MLTKPCIGQETTQGAQASLRCRSHIGGPGCLRLSACFSSDSPWADAILVLIFSLDRTFRHQLSRVSSLEVADGGNSQPPQPSDQALTMNLCPLLSLPLAWRNVTDIRSILQTFYTHTELIKWFGKPITEQSTCLGPASSSLGTVSLKGKSTKKSFDSGTVWAQGMAGTQHVL